MILERRLQVALALLLTLGTLLLGLTPEGSPWLALLAAVAAGASLWLTDIAGVVRLKQSLSTLAALVTVGIFVVDLGRLGSIRALLAGANLLVYLQVVLLFQRKDVRTYWLLLILSLVQVVVAAALSLSSWFAPLVLIYLLLALFVLSLFFALRETLIYQPQPAAGDLPQPLGSPTQRLRGARLIEGFQPAAHEDLSGTGIVRDVTRLVLWQAGFTVLLATAMFFIVPRFQKSALIPNQFPNQAIIGYNESVLLGELGSALQDPSSVMRVWFTNPTNGLPYAVAEEPLFRGAIVETYANKKWSPHVDVSASDPSELERLPRGAPHVLQKIALEEQPDVQKRLGAQKQPQNTVFSLLPAYRLDSSSPIEFDRRRQQLIRKNPTGRIEFTLATTGLDNGRQVKIIPAWEAPGSRERKRLTTLPEGPQKQELLPRLKQFAANAVANVPQQETIQRARALEAALGPANGFGYSLEGVPRNPALDPVEDFISEHKQGHCEYFATALTLMLRSQGIPARLVIGFKGGEFNSLGNYYQVRMLHAHTWVEAYLEPDQLPAGFTPRRLGGGWLTLDATPGSEESAEGRTLSLAAQAREWMDYGDYLWMNYVVGLDSRRQQEAIYGPLSLSGRAIRRVFTARFWTRTVPQWFGSLLERDTWRNLVSQRPSWSLIVLAVGLLFSLFLAWRKRKSLAGWFRRLWQWRPKLRRAQGRRGLARPRPVVPFYEQLEKLLAAHGIRRPESQTQHEFAMAAQGQLSETPRLAAAATLPRKVVDAFYQVRFGRRTLDKDELEQVQRSLRELAAALAG